ncbi:winged helix-turn-helix domain-containing protein [Paraburkholderia sp. J67]|uniref:winged helix-turn-helix domain-containing protein n=1 Tax=Paraburkholderia sp. J67 TaxID=2805435 RepID=UPI002ABE831B|nr:winged helix-turn-helix domain-containing protein [Paraburkholderia sp. J67]
MSANDIIHGPPWTDRRARAARMLASGISMELVSQKLGLSRFTARRYQTLFASGGVAALMALGDVGRRRGLAPEAQERIILAIKTTPRRQGLAGRSWTHDLVRDFIEREFGIRYSASHINRLIRDLGLRPQIASGTTTSRLTPR